MREGGKKFRSKSVGEVETKVFGVISHGEIDDSQAYNNNDNIQPGLTAEAGTQIPVK